MAGTNTTIEDLLTTHSFVKPGVETKVFKDECAYCFKSPFWPDGVFIDLNSYHCFCKEHANMYSDYTTNRLFVQYRSKKVLIENESTRPSEPTSKMAKLAIDAGPQFTFEDTYNVVVHPNFDKPIENDDNLHESLKHALHIISTATSAERLAQLSSTSSAWDAEIKLITKHANLEQENNGKTLPYSGWKCETEGCDVDDNLWLCLTDGSIRCGRSQFVSEAQKSSGNGHMQEYYSQHKYPLVVKLGTICAQLDAADVYSYDEDDAVIDPNLDKHLAHFGLDCNKMQKTVKSTMEMELDMNEKWEWAKCQEDGAVLEPAYGPGMTGLINTGSSCYMNSVLQALLQIEEFKVRFIDGSWEILANVPIWEVYTDFNGQMSKVLMAMDSGDYSKPDEGAINAIKPLQFKRVAAGNNQDFSSAKQQDCEEYIRFLCEKITENTSSAKLDPTYSLKFKYWNRFEDIASSKVRYTEQEELLLRLSVPQDLLVPIPDVENRFSVDMKQALKSVFEPSIVEGYKSPITGESKGASNTLRFKTFPDYLLVQVQKFAYTLDGQIKKLDIDLEIEEELDLSEYRGIGQQAGEESLPDDVKAPSAQNKVPANIRAVADQLKDMGFTDNACIRAAYQSKGNVEIATEWLFNHLDDAGINDEFVIPEQITEEVSSASVVNIVDMGFSVHQAKYALKQTKSVQQAVEWLFENIDSIPAEGSENVPPSKCGSAPTSSQTEGSSVNTFKDGPGKYKLIGMISHMGSRPDSGHYVAHMLKKDRWVLFNDEKVAYSQDPPKKLAYIYLYKRI